MSWPRPKRHKCDHQWEGHQEISRSLAVSWFQKSNFAPADQQYLYQHQVNFAVSLKGLVSFFNGARADLTELLLPSIDKVPVFHTWQC